MCLLQTFEKIVQLPGVFVEAPDVFPVCLDVARVLMEPLMLGGERRVFGAEGFRFRRQIVGIGHGMHSIIRPFLLLRPAPL